MEDFVTAMLKAVGLEVKDLCPRCRIEMKREADPLCKVCAGRELARLFKEEGDDA